MTTKIDIILPKSVNPLRRSKRKGIPVKSPTHCDLESSPGVVFKFPIYFPPLPSAQSPPSPARSSTSSSSTGEDESKDKMEGGIILHYPVLLSHVARRKYAKPLDFGAPKVLKAKSSTIIVNKQRRSSAQLSFGSMSHSNLSSEDTSQHEIDITQSRALTSSRASPDNIETTGQKKYCASCEVTNTPCWRPGWSDHAPLCNSCGLRYRKTKFYCKHCLYIPLRSEFSNNSKCRKCFNDLQ